MYLQEVRAFVSEGSDILIVLSLCFQDQAFTLVIISQEPPGLSMSYKFNCYMKTTRLFNIVEMVRIIKCCSAVISTVAGNPGTIFLYFYLLSSSLYKVLKTLHFAADDNRKVALATENKQLQLQLISLFKRSVLDGLKDCK